MTDTTTTTAAAAATARRGWLIHPVQAWRAWQAALAERADAEAQAGGLTVEDLGRGVRRYRDPALDQLAARRAGSVPYAGVRNDEPAAGWSSPTLVVAAGALVELGGGPACGTSRVAEASGVGLFAVGPAAPANRMTDRPGGRAEAGYRTALPGGLNTAGAGAVPDPPPPHKARCARSFPDGSAERRFAGNHLAVGLDAGDPAGPVPDALRAGTESHAPARP